ncbi:MAG: hypothetical protein WA160_03340 [Pseudobdellovibrio sp.]
MIQNKSQAYRLYKKISSCLKKSATPWRSKLTETGCCPYCNSYINNGEYDWVLAEITQEADYVSDVVIGSENKNLLISKLPDYSKQLIEDRASNAFMHTKIIKMVRDLDGSATKGYILRILVRSAELRRRMIVILLLMIQDANELW